jgi:aryl-alcohol dehydrogenase-like predicted oxidoreductase
MQMRFTLLGNSGLKISELCLGTWNFLWTADRESSLAILDAFYEGGGNLIDTANVYTRQGAGVGSVETLLGEWVKSRQNRYNVIIATKVRSMMWDGPNGQGLSRGHIMKAVEDSLKRLQTDFIDLYQIHFPDMETPIEETIRAFDDLIRQGKVHYIGCSNFSNPWRLAEAILVSQYEGMNHFISYQPHYNIAYREEVERWLLPVIKKYRLGVISWSPLEGGLLTGKYRRNQPMPDTKRAERMKHLLTERNFRILDRLESVSQQRGKTIPQIALAWIMEHDWITAPIIGANSVEQLHELFGAQDIHLTSDELAELDEVSRWDKPDWWPVGL